MYDMIAVLDVTTTILAVAGVLGAAWLGWVGLKRLRRNLLKGPEHGSSVWSLDDLREMRQSGQITEQEYQTLRRQVIKDQS